MAGADTLIALLPSVSARVRRYAPGSDVGLALGVVALANGHWAEAVHWHALSPLAVVMLAALLWNPPRLARLWMPCFAAFGVYGVWRMVF